MLLEPEEADLIPSTMGGKPVLVGKFAHSLRTRLWAEYLGVLCCLLLSLRPTHLATQ